MKTYENSCLIAAIDTNRLPRVIIGYVSKINVRNDKDDGLSKVYMETIENPNKALHFRYTHSTMQYISFLCGSCSANREDGLEFCFETYQSAIKKYKEARKKERKKLNGCVK